MVQKEMYHFSKLWLGSSWVSVEAQGVSAISPNSTQISRIRIRIYLYLAFYALTIQSFHFQ